MNNEDILYDVNGLLTGRDFLFLRNNWRAELDGFGVDEKGYCYDIILENGGFLAKIHNEINGKIRDCRLFARRITARQFLTKKYKELNEY